MTTLTIQNGTQVLVDGVPAIVHGNAFFAPGSARPMNVMGRFIVGQWVDAFLKEREMQVWNPSRTRLFGTRFCAVGGRPKQNARHLIVDRKPRPNDKWYDRPIVRQATVTTAIAEHRVELNFDASTHIDYQAWLDAFRQVYSES